MADVGAPVDVELPAMPPVANDQMVATENDDGTVDIDVQPHEAERPQPAFNDNLAEFMDETVLSKIAEKVIDGEKVDRDSAAEWSSMLTQGMELLGLTFATRSFPFDGASGEFDPILLEAVLRNAATTTSELLPAEGPAKTQIVGMPTEQSEQKAERTKAFMNYYLQEAAPEWPEGMEQLCFWRAIAGDMFKKVYQDPILNRPVSPMVTPDKIVFNYNTDSDLENCPRITHIIDYTYKELKQRQLSGFYRDVTLMPPSMENGGDDIITQKIQSISGIQPATPLDDSDFIDQDFQCLEQHVDMDLEGYEHKDEEGLDTGLPLPYIITVEKTTRRVLAIRRNWREGDDSFQKNHYFVHYRLFPGLGSRGIGYAHILGNPAKAATGLLRQMKDAETLALFPGGMRVKGLRFDDNNKMIGPCEWIEVETGGLPINHAISPMPYRGASEVSLALWEKSRENAKNMASMADLSVGDGRQDAPVGTTLALLEAANRLMSATVKSAHRSLRKELKLFAALFGQYLPEKPYPFPVPGGMQAIMRADFSDEIDVIPVSDPNITSYAQRVSTAEARLRIAQQFPQIHDLREACRQMYVAMGTDERKITAILPPPQTGTPSDPLTENQMALGGKPLQAAAYQDHQAHVQAHSVLLEQVPNIAAHISEHLGMAMRVNVEKELGITLPPMGTKLPPEIENRIAVLCAAALQKLKDPNGPEPTPGQIAMAEIQVEAQKVQATLQQISQRAASEAFRTQMDAQQKEKDRQQRAADSEADRQARMRTEVIASATQRAIAASRNKQMGERARFGGGNG